MRAWRSPLVWNLDRGRFPRSERLDGLFGEQLFSWDGALAQGLGNFPVYVVVIESDLRGVHPRVTVVDVLETGPVDRAQTHGTGFAACVDRAPHQAECAQFGARPTDRNDFRMGRRVVRVGDLVCAFPNDLAVLYDNSPERTSGPIFHVPFGEGDGGTHEVVMIHGFLV